MVVCAGAPGGCDRPNPNAGAPSSAGGRSKSAATANGVAPDPNSPPRAAPRLVTETRGDPAKGKRLWAAFGCATCHAIDGKNPQGPTLKGYWMTVRKLDDGREVIADVEYTRRAIVDPLAEVVPGYPVPMTGFKGLLDDEQVDHLVAYIRSLSN